MAINVPPEVAFGQAPVPTPGIHWFGPGGSGVAYPQPPTRWSPGVFDGRPIHWPIRPIFGGGGPFHGIPNPGIQPHGIGLAHVAARRAAHRAMALRRTLY